MKLVELGVLTRKAIIESMLKKKIKTYTEAVERGDYNLYTGNLHGKYDNVRTCWENQLTMFAVSPFLEKIAADKKKQGKKVRILDLGCGSGQGYELITRMDKRKIDLGLQHDRVLPEQEIDIYLGLDYSQAMVDKGNEIFKNKPNVKFKQVDLTNGLKDIKDEEPFDVYFSSYGSLSHLSKDALYGLLVDISNHSNNGSIIVMDIMGRFSIEWPDYWTAESEEEKVRDYSMCYLYTEADKDVEIEHFPVRFWSGKGIDALNKKLNDETDNKFEIVKKVDRSILTGRHTDTCLYNKNLIPMRRMINSLHENYLRTDLEELIFDTDIIPDHPEVKPFMNEFVKSWNILVNYCNKRLQDKSTSLVELENWDQFSSALQYALMVIDRVVNDTEWMWYGEPRSNIIEPQLGYALRSLEVNMQKGLGCGHGFIVILKINK